MNKMRPITEGDIIAGLDAAALARNAKPIDLAPYWSLPPERVLDDGRDWLRVASCGQTEPSMARIMRAVALRTGVSTLEIKSPRRFKKIVRARMLYIWITHKLTSRSLTQIGRFTGGRDHSTVIHAIRSVDAGRKHFEPELSELLAAFTRKECAR